MLGAMGPFLKGPTLMLACVCRQAVEGESHAPTRLALPNWFCVNATFGCNAHDVCPQQGCGKGFIWQLETSMLSS